MTMPFVMRRRRKEEALLTMSRRRHFKFTVAKKFSKARTLSIFTTVKIGKQWKCPSLVLLFYKCLGLDVKVSLKSIFNSSSNRFSP